MSALLLILDFPRTPIVGIPYQNKIKGKGTVSYTVDIDIGGTYTDGFFSDGQRFAAVKVDTTPHDLTLGFLECIELGAKQLALSGLQELLRETDIIRFSTTLCNNLLIQRKGLRLGLIVTAGHERMLYSNTPREGVNPFDFLIDPSCVVGIDEETAADGRVISEPNETEVVSKTRHLLEQGVRMIVVSLRRASFNPANEKRVRQTLDLEYPPHYLGHVPVLLSHQVSRRPEDALRTTAGMLNAYLHGELGRSLYRAEEIIRQQGFRRTLFIVHGNAGIARVSQTRALDTVNSGPAAAMHGAAGMARRLSLPRVIALDIGGTSTEISLIRNGIVHLATQQRIAGLDAGITACRIESLGGGGGSIARRNGESITVGPDSAGALPGPACFDLGGLEPTVTDAFLIAGFLDPDYFLGGSRLLHPERAKQALETLRRTPSESLPYLARRVVDCLKDTLAAAITNQLKDENPADWTLFTFGGAGGLYAAMLAETLGIRQVYTFPVGSVFSAFGSSLLEVVHVYEYCLAGQAHLTNGRLALGGWFRELLDHARKDIVGEALGTDHLRFRLQIEVADDKGITTVFETDVTQNQESLDSPRTSETNGAVIMARLKAIIPTATPLLEVLPSMIKTETRPAPMGERSVFWSNAAENTPIYRGESLPAGTSLQGPLIIELAYTTILTPHGWCYRIDAAGHEIMERGPA